MPASLHLSFSLSARTTRPRLLSCRTRLVVELVLVLLLLLLPNIPSSASPSQGKKQKKGKSKIADVLYEGKFGLNGEGPAFFIRRLVSEDDEAAADDFFYANSFYYRWKPLSKVRPEGLVGSLGKHILALYHLDEPMEIVSAIAAVHIGDFATYLAANSKLRVKAEWWGESRHYFDNSFHTLAWAARETRVGGLPLLHYFHTVYLAALPAPRPKWLTASTNRGRVSVYSNYLHLGYRPFAQRKVSLWSTLGAFFLRRGQKVKLDQMDEVKSEMCKSVEYDLANFASNYTVHMYREAYPEELADTCRSNSSSSTP